MCPVSKIQRKKRRMKETVDDIDKMGVFKRKLGVVYFSVRLYDMA